jgi:antitoxin HicB
MLTYPVTLTPDEGTYLVTSPDFPEIVTFGETKDGALVYAVGAFDEAIAARIAYREAIPTPSKTKRGQKLVTLPSRTEIKVALYRQMRARKMSKAALARALDKHPPQVDRLLDVHHGSTVAQVEEALKAVGLRLTVEPDRGRHRTA